MGAGTSPVELEFFSCGNPDDLSATSQRPIFTKINLVTKRTSVSRRGIRKDIFGNFHSRGHLPQNLKSKVGQTGTSLKVDYRSWDALHSDRPTVYSTL